MSRSVESYEASEFMRNELAKVRAINVELLAALEDALSIFGPEPGEQPVAPKWMARAQAAIAKATGSAE